MTTADPFAGCSSAADIRNVLSALNEREQAVTTKLDALLATQRDLTRHLGKLDLARAQLSPQVLSLRAISNGMLASASSTASRISLAVKRLDTEAASVRTTLDVVRQVAELKACVLGVHASMGAPQDWETAATYLARARKVPEPVIRSAFAEEIVPTAEVPAAPSVTLHEAAEGLRTLFLREFESAARAGDGARVTRFFKLFPLIGRDAVGLDAYGRYVCGGVAGRAREVLANAKDDGLVTALTRLFEHIAQIVDGHEPVVTRHYGPGTMGKVVERLQVEADVQGALIIDSWTDEKELSRRITQVKSYAFSFLVQSFLANRTGSPDLRQPEDIDMKDVDALLGQMSVMLGRWALYVRFLGMKITDDMSVPQLITNSSLYKKVTQSLVEPFGTLSTFFIRRSIEKSFELDEAPADLHLSARPLKSSPPFITSVVDDVMYIVNKVIQRALGTGMYAVAAAVIPSVGRVLGSDFYGMIQRRMRDESYPKATVQGALPPETLIVSFIVLTNNLDVAADYVKRIVGAVPDLREAFPFGHEAADVGAMLQDLEAGFAAKTTDLIEEAISLLLKNVVRLRARPVVNDAFRDAQYIGPDEDESVVGRFARGWEAFMTPIKRLMTERNYERLLKASVQHLAKLVEKRIWTFYGKVDELGAVRMERDVTGIVHAAVGGAKYELRDEFARCTQMMLVLNMDPDEAPLDVEWRLDTTELDNVRAMLVKT